MQQHEVKITGTAGNASKAECMAAAKALRDKLENKQKTSLAVSAVKALRLCAKNALTVRG